MLHSPTGLVQYKRLTKSRRNSMSGNDLKYVKLRLEAIRWELTRIRGLSDLPINERTFANTLIGEMLDLHKLWHAALADPVARQPAMGTALRAPPRAERFVHGRQRQSGRG